MKYFDNRYKKREKLVAQARRLREPVTHTKRPIYSHLVYADINQQLYALFPVYYTKYSAPGGRNKKYRVKYRFHKEHPILKAC